MSPTGYGLPFILLFGTAVALSQNAPHSETTKAAKEPDTTFQSGVNLVLVPVVVRDAQGRPIGKSTKDDFQLFDRDKRQTIASFSAVERGGGGSETTALKSGAGNLRLRPETFTRAMNSGITLRSDLDAKVGTYTIRLVLREAQSNAMTAITSPLKIF